MSKMQTDSIFDQSLGFVVADVARLMRRKFNRRIRDLNLTESQWRILVSISRDPAIRQAQLADLLDMHPISVARQIDRMEKAGWVKRQKDPKDRRAVNLHITGEMQSVVKKMLDRGREVRMEALAGIPERDRQNLLKNLLVMRQNLSDELG